MAAGTGEFVIVIVRADALGAPSLAVVLTEGATVSVAVEVGALFWGGKFGPGSGDLVKLPVNEGSPVPGSTELGPVGAVFSVAVEVGALFWGGEFGPGAGELVKPPMKEGSPVPAGTGLGPVGAVFEGESLQASRGTAYRISISEDVFVIGGRKQKSSTAPPSNVLQSTL
jgi:hypothetical protein